MLMTEQKAPLREDKDARSYVSVGPSGLVVSTGNEPRGQSDTEESLEGRGSGIITLSDRMSGLAANLDQDEALQLAASLIRASRFLDEEAAIAEAPEVVKLPIRP